MTFCVSFVDVVVVRGIQKTRKSTGRSTNTTAWKTAKLTKFILDIVWSYTGLQI